MIKDFKPRLYQETIFNTCTSKNTLVVLPTGMGKTNIFLMLAAHRMKLYPKSKILFIGPTKPLIDQYLFVFKKHFEIPEEDMAVFTGLVKPEKRAELWKTAKIIFSTPQGLENDIIAGRINLEDVSLLGIDEAHRAVGDYAYVWLTQQYVKKARYARVLALTASPGSDLEKIEEVCNNLKVEHIEVRTDKDPDVLPYIQEVEIEWVKVSLPPIFSDIQKSINIIIKDRMEKLKKWGVLKRKDSDLKYVSKTDLLRLQGELRGKAVSAGRDFVLWNAISVLAEIMKIQHGLELLETQGIPALHSYMEKLQKDGAAKKTKAVKNLISDVNFRTALIKTDRLFSDKVEHPKLIELQKIVGKEVKKSKDLKIIVFNQYRDNAANIVDVLNKIEGINAKLFVGQIKKGETGLSQKEQKIVLEKFREGEFNVIVATSIGEEGLDIPKVDLVIFYEPIPSAIRTIQRRGRTGRLEKGRVIMLMTENTRDVGYKWSAHHKEKRMYRTLDKIKKKLGIKFATAHSPQPTIEKYVKEEDKIKVIVDHREKGSAVIKELIEMGAAIHLEKLDSADYLLSSRVGIEFKTSEDFVNSLIDGRLLQQMRELKEKFERPLVIVEGEQDIYSIRNVHPNSIRGMLATISVSYGIPILFTNKAIETASLMKIIAKREQEEAGSEFAAHGEKKGMSLREWQEYIISSLPGVGPSLAKPLLRKFKSVKNIVNASEKELQKVEKIGNVKAKKIKDVFDSEYKI
ncbi:MAG: DEAD/DEAH box helicase [Nanoarchaeota archaeon]|nr:DEAD/DEAH box helicase [Nanoarchaeota archaeon]